MKALGIVGARLNSSRLPCKQLLDLAGRPVIARIFERLERVPELTGIVLATTADDYNRPLVEWARAAGKEVFAYEGDVDDLTARADALVRKYDPDLVAYFCGDSPLIEPATVSLQLNALAASPDGHIATLAGAYIHEGIQVYSRGIWRWIADHSTTVADREHLGSAALRHPALVRVQVADDPIFALKHRISVDTVSDYLFMRTLYERWYATQPADTIVSLRWAVEEIRRDAALRAVNGHVRQKGLHDRSQRWLLVAQGRERCLRALAIARGLQDFRFAGVSLLLHGDAQELGVNALIPHRLVGEAADLAAETMREIEKVQPDWLLFDLPADAPCSARTRAMEIGGLPGAERLFGITLEAITGASAGAAIAALPGDPGRPV